ncbi:MAG TPA: peptidase M23, partial [Mycobacterium sp.]|nr:peptidase M23 [Mycobacterium sp.]
MRRTPGAAASRLGGRLCAALLTAGVLFATPGLAVAQPASSDSLAALVAAVANADQKLHELGAAIQAQQEGVNKAILDVQTARDNAAAAQREVDASRQRVDETNIAIAAAQQRFDTFAAATYVNGPSDSYLTASDPADILNTAAAGQTLSVSAQRVISDLQRARTEQVNKDSAARLAKQNADKAVADAEASQQTAVSALTEARQTFSTQQAELDKLTAERAAAQAKPDQARAWSAPATGQPAARPAAANPGAANPTADWDRAPQRRDAATGNWATGWDPTL